ncbi:hypothetical protein TNCV_1600311 [Trichonephila clavipes]|nr:hypothetical protein TNCV_1600311 [Trichonephila clavipes]
MYATTEITVCPFSNKHSATLMSLNIMTNGFRVKLSSALWLLELNPQAKVAKQHSHALSLVKSSNARLRHILLHISVPFHEITPNKYPAPERKDVTYQKCGRKGKIGRATIRGFCTKRMPQCTSLRSL